MNRCILCTKASPVFSVTHTHIHTVYIILLIVLLFQEKSQALQSVTMLDILMAIHAEYHTIRELELCVPTVNVAKRDDLIRRIMLMRDLLVSRNPLQNVDTLKYSL